MSVVLIVIFTALAILCAFALNAIVGFIAAADEADESEL